MATQVSRALLVRKPDDIPAFNPEVIKLFASARGQLQQAAQ